MSDKERPERGRFLVAEDLQLVSVAEVTELLGVHRETINNLVREGDFPQPVRIGSRHLRWRLSQIREWIENGGAKPQSADAS